MNIYEQINKNKGQTWFVITLFGLFFIFIGMGLDYYFGAGYKAPVYTLIAFSFAAISSLIAYWSGDKMVLASTRAKPLDLNDQRQRQWQNVVEEMSIASGIPLPKTYIIDDDDPNAFATGRDPRHSSIAVTRGLLEILNRDELQAVASHEMSHIRNYDIRLMLILTILVGSIALLSDWAGRGFFRGRRSGGRSSSSSSSSSGTAGLIILAIWLIAIIIAPLISQLMAMAVSRKREYLADASGAELTRNPVALAVALEKIESYAEPTKAYNQGNAHLWICDPRGIKLNEKEGWGANLFATHPPLVRRVEALRDMAYLGKEIK